MNTDDLLQNVAERINAMPDNNRDVWHAEVSQLVFQLPERFHSMTFGQICDEAKALREGQKLSEVSRSRRR